MLVGTNDEISPARTDRSGQAFACSHLNIEPILRG
jgi:hypothetical protein